MRCLTPSFEAKHSGHKKDRLCLKAAGPHRALARAHREQLHLQQGSRSSRLVCCAGKKLQVVFVTTEVAPWSKSGGLADVLSGLPAALAARGHRVMTVSPRYGDYTDAIDSGARAPVHVGTSSTAAKHSQILPPTAVPQPPKDPLVKYFVSDVGDGVQYVFVDHPIFQQQHKPHNVHNPHSIPTYSHGVETADHQARNSVLCQAALAAPLLLWPSAGQANLTDKERVEWAALTDALAYSEVKSAAAPPAATAAGGWTVTNGIAASRAFPIKKGPATGAFPSTLTNRPAQPSFSPAFPAGRPDIALPHQPGQHLHLPPWMLGASSSTHDHDVSDQIIFVANDWSTGLLPLYFQYPQHADHPSSTSDSPGQLPGAPAAGGNAPAQLESAMSQHQVDQVRQGTSRDEASPVPPGEHTQDTAVQHPSGSAASQGIAVGGQQAARQRSASQPPVATQQRAPAPAPALAAQPSQASDVDVVSSQGVGPGATQPGVQGNDPATVQQSGAQIGQRVKLRKPDRRQKQLVVAGGRVVKQASREQGTDNSSSVSDDTSGSDAEVTVSEELEDEAEAGSGAADMVEAAAVAASAAAAVAASEPGDDVQLAAGVAPAADGAPDVQEVDTEAPREVKPRKSLASLPAPAAKGSAAKRKASKQQEQLDLEKLRQAERARQQDLAAVKAVQTRLSAFQRLVTRRLKNAKFVFTIHNLGYQGLFSADSFNLLGLPSKSALQTMLTQPTTNEPEPGSPEPLATAPATPLAAADAATTPAAEASAAAVVAGGDGAEAKQVVAAAATGVAPAPASPPPAKNKAGVISWLQAALMTSDMVVTVSPAYAQEVMQQAETATSSPGIAAPAQPAAEQVIKASPSSTGSQLGVHTRRLYEAISERGVIGIMNGIDTVVWSPQSDTYLPRSLRYDVSNVHQQKAAAKAMLQNRLGLKVDPDAPLFAFIGRLDEQKGVDAMLAALPYILGKPTSDVIDMRTGRCAHPTGTSGASKGPNQLLNKAISSKATGPSGPPPQPPADGSQPASEPRPSPPEDSTQPSTAIKHVSKGAHAVQVAMLGAGQEWYTSCLSQLSAAWPGAALGHGSFNEPLAHLLMAAADYLLVPSRYEPCGLVALCAVRYGTLPIVSPVGGLKQIVRPAGSYQAAAPTSQPDAPSGTATSASDAQPSTASAQPWTRQPTDLGLLLPHPVSGASDPVAFRSSVQDVEATVRQAVELYGTREFYQMRERCMQQDVSWDKSAEAWEKTLMSLMQDAQAQPESATAVSESATESAPCFLEPPQDS